MAITKLIYGHTGLRGLYLMPEDWYDDRHITVRLTTTVDGVDLEKRVVHVATGELIPYDRLILTAGSSGASPRATASRSRACSSYARPTTRWRSGRTCRRTRRARPSSWRRPARLEAAYALQKVGLGVTVINHGPQLLDRQLDPTGGSTSRSTSRGSARVRAQQRIER